MGLQPIPPPKRHTRLEQAQHRYIQGELTFSQFDALVTDLLASGRGDETMYARDFVRADRIPVVKTWQ